MPPDFFNNNRVLGFAFSAILAFSDRHVDCGRWFSFSFELKVKTTKDCGTHDTRLSQSRVNYVESYHLHLGHYLFCEEDFNGFWKCNCILEAVHFNVFPPLECQCCGVKKCGIHLLHTPDPTSMEDPSTCFNYNEEDWDRCHFHSTHLSCESICLNMYALFQVSLPIPYLEWCIWFHSWCGIVYG